MQGHTPRWLASLRGKRQEVMLYSYILTLGTPGALNNFSLLERNFSERRDETRRDREGQGDVVAVGEERDVEVDSEEDEGLEALLRGLRDGLRGYSGYYRIRSDASHQLPQRATRSTSPHQRSPRFPDDGESQ